MTNEWKFGTQESFSKTYAATFNLKAGANSKIRATATVSTAVISVPYTITSYPKRDPSIEVETKGTWTGLTSWNLTYTVDEREFLFFRVG